MKIVSTLKALTMISAASLALSAGIGHAQMVNPGYYNPWLNGYTPQHLQNQMAMKEHLDRFEERLENQFKLILQGMENGKLTQRESIGLLREHLAIGTLERRYLADGKLGMKELQDLVQRLDQAGRSIRQEVRDSEVVRERRGNWPGNWPGNPGGNPNPYFDRGN